MDGKELAMEFLLYQRLREGHSAVAQVVERRGDRWRSVELLDDAVLAEIVIVDSGGVSSSTERPLTDAISLAEAGAKVERISAPGAQNTIGWDAAAVRKTVDRHPTESAPCVFVGRRAVEVGNWSWAVRAGDWRGFAAATLFPWRAGDDPDGWQPPWIQDARSMGQRIRRLYDHSPIQGVQARLRGAPERLDPDEAESLLAEAALEEGVGGDEFVITYASDTEVRVVVEHVASLRGRTESEVRNAIAGRFLRTAEAAAFGTGIASPRAKSETWSLDEFPDLAVEAEFEARVVARQTLVELRDRAGLTPREAEVFALKRGDPDRTDAEIGARLNMSPSTVGVHWHNVREKLRKAGGSPS